MSDLNEGPPIDYFDDLAPEVSEPATLERLSALADEHDTLAKEVQDATVALAERQGRLDKIERQRIPDIMTELGMEEFKMKDGRQIKVKDDIRCGVTEERKPQAWAWLEEHNYDGIIKTKVTAEFGKSEMSKAKEALAALEAAGFGASLDRSVHPATLKSFVKERLEAGEAIPIDTFGVFEFKIAKITLPKKRK